MRNTQHFDEGGGAESGGGDARAGMGFGGTGSGLSGTGAGAASAGVGGGGEGAGAGYSGTKPGESQMASDAAKEFAAKMTPEQMHQAALTLGVRSDPAWSYNFNNPGWQEKIMNALYVAPNTKLYKWGMRTPGVSSDQMFTNETPAEKDTRLKLVGGAIENAANTFASLSPIGPVWNGIKTVGNLMSGQITPGGLITNLAMSMAASKLGISTSTLSAALAGDMGGVAKSAALGAVSKEVSQQSGLPSAITNYGLNATGLNSAIGNTVSGAVNGALPNTATGLTKSNIAGAIDRGIGAIPAGPGSLNSMDAFNPSQDVLMGTPTPSGPTQSPTVPLEEATVKPPTLLGTPMAANSKTAPAGNLVKLGRTGGDSGPYRESLDQYALAPSQHKWALNQSMTSSDAQKLLNMLDQNAPVFAKEGGSIQHFAGGSQGGVYGSGLDVASMYTDPAQKDAMDTLQKMSDQGDIKTPEGMKTRGGLLALGQSGAPSQQRAVQQMAVIPQLAALLQARGMHLPMRMAEGGTSDHEHPHYDGTPLFRTGGLESLGGKYVEGKGDGTSDDIAAMLANGEYVFSADVVSALGNGSNKAGAKELDQMVQAIRARARSASPDKLPPDAKPPLEYLKSSKGKTHG